MACHLGNHTAPLRQQTPPQQKAPHRACPGGSLVSQLHAQLAVDGETGKYREFKGNVKCIDARPFWRDPEVSPSGAGYHYNHNAETYMEVGDAPGRAMAELLNKQKD